MKRSFLFCLLPLLFGCTESPKPTNDTTATAPAAATAPVSDTGLGLIIGDGVRIREQASVNSAILSKISTGERLEILEVAPPGDSTTLDACEVFPMVQVKTASGRKGWVFGKFVYRVYTNDHFFNNLNPVPFDGRMLELKRCHNFGTGAADQVGLTGCDDYYPVLLYDTKTGELFPVAMAQPQNQVPNFKFWCLEDDEGGGEHPTGLRADAQKITAGVFAEYMEGCGSYDVYITKGLKGYQAVSADYKQMEEKDCVQKAQKQ